MSKTDTMAKLPGLFQRAGVWTLRVMIPLDFRVAYCGSTELVGSLQKTSTTASKTRRE